MASDVDEVKELRKEIRQLRAEVAEQQRELAQRRHENNELAKRVEILGEELAWARQKLFGRSSEKFSDEEQRQGRLFNEAETEAGGPEAPVEPPLEVPAHQRRHPVRKPLPASLPRIEVVLDISEADKHCACGHDLVRIGQEISEKLDVIPPQLRVIRTIRPRVRLPHLRRLGG